MLCLLVVFVVNHVEESLVHFDCHEIATECLILAGILCIQSPNSLGVKIDSKHPIQAAIQKFFVKHYFGYCSYRQGHHSWQRRNLNHFYDRFSLYKTSNECVCDVSVDLRKLLGKSLVQLFLTLDFLVKVSEEVF